MKLGKLLTSVKQLKVGTKLKIISKSGTRPRNSDQQIKELLLQHEYVLQRRVVGEGCVRAAGER